MRGKDTDRWLCVGRLRSGRASLSRRGVEDGRDGRMICCWGWGAAMDVGIGDRAVWGCGDGRGRDGGDCGRLGIMTLRESGGRAMAEGGGSAQVGDDFEKGVLNGSLCHSDIGYVGLETADAPGER